LVPLPRKADFFNVKGGFAPRCALAGELLFSVAKKVTKNALYRPQKVAVRVDRRAGWVFDRGAGLKSSCPFVMVVFG